MNEKREAEILEAAIEKYGAEAQLGVAQEECAELIVALSKWKRAQGDLTELAEKVREEIADVFIMLMQLEMIFGDTSAQEEEKLLRLERRLCNEDKKS